MIEQERFGKYSKIIIGDRLLRQQCIGMCMFYSSQEAVLWLEEIKKNYPSINHASIKKKNKKNIYDMIRKYNKVSYGYRTMHESSLNDF